MKLRLQALGCFVRKQAFDSFNKAIDEREGWLVWLKLEPSFDSLRSDARYAELLRRMGPLQ